MQITLDSRLLTADCFPRSQVSSSYEIRRKAASRNVIFRFRSQTRVIGLIGEEARACMAIKPSALQWLTKGECQGKQVPPPQELLRFWVENSGRIP